MRSDLAERLAIEKAIVTMIGCDIYSARTALAGGRTSGRHGRG